MKIESPFLEIDDIATDEIINSSITAIKGQVDAFVILSKSEMDYVQALACDHGYVVQFQEGTIRDHYEFNTYLSRPQAIKLFQCYLSREPNWQSGIPFSKVDLTDFWGKLGYRVGLVTGRILKAFKVG